MNIQLPHPPQPCSPPSRVTCLPATHPSRRWLLKGLAGVLASATAPAWAQGKESAGGRIVLGQSAVFSGPGAHLGMQLNQGARLCFQQVNAAGGVNGQQIDLLSMDDGYDPDRCRTNTGMFIDNGVFALFGYLGTATTMAALPLVNSTKIPLFAPCTGTQALREPFNRQIFHIRASYEDETALIVRQLTGLGLRKIAVFRQSDGYGLSGLDGVVKALGAQGLAPVAVGSVERDSVDVSAALQAILPARPDAVVQIGHFKASAAFIREARKTGYGGTFYNVSLVGTQALGEELGRDGRGVMISQVMPYPFSNHLPIVREYQEALKAAGGVRASYTSIEGYIAARVFVEGLRRAKAPTREAFIAALEAMPDLDLGGYKLGFSPTEHVGSRFAELSMLTENGSVRR